MASEVNTVSTTYTVGDNMRFLAFLKEAYLLPRSLGVAFGHIFDPHSVVFVLICWPHRGAFAAFELPDKCSGQWAR